MNLAKLKITDFKCIEDSNEFDIDELTCLVGKNEAGKTAILQALRKLNPLDSHKAKFDSLEFPRRKDTDNEESITVLRSTWKLEQSDLDEIAEKFGKKALNSGVIEIELGYSNKQLWSIDFNEPEILKFLFSESSLTSGEKEDLTKCKSVQELIKSLETKESRSDSEQSFQDSIQAKFKRKTAASALIDTLHPKLPKFLYFSDYYQLPGRISVNELVRRRDAEELCPSDEVFLALLGLIGSNLDEICEIENSEELIAKLERLSNRLQKVLVEYWSQNQYLKTRIQFGAGKSSDPAPFNTGNVFQLRIENTRHDVTINFDERSTGFVWFFSFLVWFSQATDTYGNRLFFLLDEPGLTLHGSAQADLLRYFKDRLLPAGQVMYTTHSPFMIDAENLQSVRTVEDASQDGKVLGTKVSSKILSQEAGTLFPLQAALGYDLTQTIFIGPYSLLVEGPSDLFYLQWASNQLSRMGEEGLDPRWVITPVRGADKAEAFVSLFGANKLNIVALLDYASGQKQKIKQLRECGLIDKDKVLTLEVFAKQKEADIEDILGRSMYVRLVNDTYNLRAQQQLPAKLPKGAPERVVKEVETYFKTLPAPIPEFNHFEPARFLMQEDSEYAKQLPEFESAMKRFGEIFKKINSFLH